MAWLNTSHAICFEDFSPCLLQAICSKVPRSEASIYCRAWEKSSGITGEVATTFFSPAISSTLQFYIWHWFFFWTIQSEGIDVSAEMEFLSQQNIMLDLENKALKQRLESLAQEQLIKRCKYAPFWFGVPTLLFLSALKC